LIAERRRSPLASGVKRDGSSPPSPVFERPPRLDLRERDRVRARVACAADLQQAPQSRPARGVLVDHARVLAVLLERRALAHGRVRLAVALQRGAHVTVGGAHRLLHERDRLGIPHVVLAVAAPCVDAADRQQLLAGAAVRRIRAGMTLERLRREHVDADAADARGGVGEVLVDQLPVQTDRLEDLRAAVGLDRRDAHLGDRLQQSFADRLDDVLGRGLAAERDRRRIGSRACDAPFGDQLIERLEHQVRVDRTDAVADQCREVVHLARLAGLDDDAHAQASPLEYKMVVNGGDGEQRRDRGAARAELAVGQDDDVHPFGDRLARLAADTVDRLAHPGRSLGDRPGDVDRARRVDVMVDVAQRLELAVEQDRLVEQELVGVLGGLFEHVALVAQARRQAHHDFLADRVDRRVCHLREQLLEVGEQRRRLVGEDRQRDVVAHRADGLGAFDGHRRQQHPQVLLGVAERALAQVQGLV
jgi:hypothetical protein